MTAQATDLRTTVNDIFGIDLSPGEYRNLTALLREADEMMLVDFFDARVEGGLDREDCIRVSNLLADFSGPVEFHVDALAANGQRIASETIQADASDTALHQMADRHPEAAMFEAVDVTSHNGVPDDLPMWEYRRYLDAVRTFMLLRAEAGERPTKTLGSRNGAWAHTLMDRLLEAADDPARCRRKTERLEEQIREMRRKV